MLKSSVVVLDETTKGAIIRIEVRGEWPDGRGDDLSELVAVALALHDPHCFVIDLRETKGTLRADTLGGLLRELLRKRGGVLRPVCVVATGNTARGCRWFLEASKASKLADVAVVANVASAMAHLGRRLRFEEAELAARNAVELAPDRADALGNLAAVLLGQGKFDEARQIAQKAVAADPADVKSKATLSAVNRMASKRVQWWRRLLNLRRHDLDSV